MIPLLLLALTYFLFGLLYALEVRRLRKPPKLELRYWVAALTLGFLLLSLLFVQWAWLVLTGAVRRVLDYRI